MDKLKSYISRYPSIKWGFLIVVYDSEDMWKPSSHKLKKSGYEKISVSSINLRRKEDSERRRNSYDEWRAKFDRYIERHF